MTVMKGSRYADKETTFAISEVDGSLTLARVRPFEIEPERGDSVYVTQQGDTYWRIAGKPQVYNDPHLWWVIASANPSPDLFKNQLEGMEGGEELRIPPADKVFARTDGRPANRVF